LNLQEKLSCKALSCLHRQAEEIEKSRANAPFPSPSSVYVIYDANAPIMMVQGSESAKALPESLGFVFGEVNIELATVDEAISAANKAEKFDWLIYLSSQLTPADERVGTLLGDHPHSAVWLVRTPYLFPWFKKRGAKRVYALYERTPWMMKAAVGALLGQEAEGRLAVQVEDYAPGYKACEIPND
jgi:beta-N-acetylhexosaminidase